MHDFGLNRRAERSALADVATHQPLFTRSTPKPPSPVRAPSVDLDSRRRAHVVASLPSLKQPRGLFVVCAAEFCERFAGCLLLSLLVLYLTEQLGVAPAAAVRRVSMFSALGYAAALGGGWLVGRVLSAQRGATLGALLLAVGFLGLAMERPRVLPIAMVLLAAGSGLFRPSIVALLDQLYPRKDPRRDAGHLWFWVAVNVGAALAPLAAGGLRASAGWRAAFSTATVSILLCAVVLVAGRNYLSERPEPAEEERDAPDDSDALLRRAPGVPILMTVGIATLIYMAAYGQTDGALLLWARDDTDRRLLSHEVPVAWFSAVPALLVLILGPILLMAMRKLRSHGQEPSPLGKIAAGLVMAGLAYCLMAFAAFAVAPNSASPFWLVGCLALLALGELLVAPLGLALVTKLAPRRYAGLMSGLWYAVTAAGFLLAGEIGALLQQGHRGWSFAALALAVLLGAACVAGIARTVRDSLPTPSI